LTYKKVFGILGVFLFLSPQFILLTIFWGVVVCGCRLKKFKGAYMARYCVSVGEAGEIDINDREVAVKAFNHYVEESKKGEGRVGDQPVQLYDRVWNEIIEDYQPVQVLGSASIVS
jgi:hypothetical protein